MYRIQKADWVLEMEGNTGRVILHAASPVAALERAKRVFPHMRDASVAGTADRYYVDFKVDPGYDRSLLKKARRLGKLPLTKKNYDELEPHEKYMALLYAQLTGRETFLGDANRLLAALPALRNEMVRRGKVPSHDDFMDYDIAVYNAVEADE
jgi:hypothetical protein